MPDKCTLRYLPIAQDDLISIFDWIDKDSPNRASSFVDILDKRVKLLESNHWSHIIYIPSKCCQVYSSDCIVARWRHLSTK